MKRISIHQDSEDLHLLSISGASSARLSPESLTGLRDLTVEYQKSLAGSHEGTNQRLLPVGQKLWQWLSDHTGQRDAFFDNGAPKPITWRLGSLTDNNPEEPSAAAILCNAPWEILADENGFFVSQGRNKFNVIRSLPSDAEWIEPSDYRPSLLFMAASPTDQKELNYRAEEVAIDGAAGRIGIDLTVEESGSLNELAQTFSLTRAELESIDILHLSAHGGNKSGPLLVLENDTGQSEPVSPETLLSKIPASDLRLAFISSCHGGSGSEFDPGGNFSAELIERGLPAALAWGASVWDDTATDFASACYRELSQGKPLLEAAVLAGRELFNDQDARRQSNWHLPRIFLSASIKQPESVRLTTGSRKPRRQKKDSPEGNFLGGNRLIPIASFKSFVGRRRPLQGTIKAFREDNAVLLLGPGNQGKSSLAGRIARRSHSHKTLVLHGKEINATQLLERIGNLYPDDQVKDLLGPVLSSAEPQQALDTLLPQLLERIDSEHAPLLLVLDDLEQILEIGASLHRPLAERSHTIKAILTCFAAHWGDSRLLFTSRYDFTLNGQHADEHGIDGTSALCRIPLEPFSQNDHSQQLNRYLRSDARFAKLTDEQNQQLSRAMSLANGNPGLLQMLADHIVTAPEHADALLEQVASYLQAGADPTDSKVSDYLHALSIGAMYDQLSEAERALLRIPDYCKAPVPVSALLGEISNALQLDDPQGAIQRLLSFGLWDYHPDIVQPQESACAINHLVKLRLEEKWATFSEEQEQSLCQNLLHALDAAWRQRDGDTSETAEQAHLPLFLLSLQAKDSALCLRHGKPSLQQILLQNQYDVGYALAKSALELISDVSPPLLRICAELAQYAGSGEDADRWFAQAVEATPSAPPSSKEEAWESGMLLNRYGARLSQRGEFDQALDFLQRAITCYETYDLEQNVAITHGRIADIMMHRGQLDDALKIRTEQQLPVFQKLGDIREEAISHGKIADILMHRGELDEALKIRTEQELPVYQKLGDIRSEAVTHGKIADIMMHRGQFDEALKIRTEKELPVYQKLGDIREEAICHGKIADIMMQRGQFDEALKIRTEKELPVYQKLGDIRSEAVTHGEIADIMMQRGEFDEALKIRTEKELPVYQKLGDIREEATVWNNLFDIYWHKEEHQAAAEAIEKAFKLVVQLQVADGLSVVGFKFGQVLISIGQPAAASKVLEISRQAAEKLEDMEQVEAIDKILAEHCSDVAEDAPELTGE